MVKINLLPHREARRKERRTAFVAMLGAAMCAGGLLVIVVGGVISSRIAVQNERNDFIQAENTKLDVQIKEIATLKQEIAALKARQQAVEDLQSDRNQPVYLMDELVKQVPDGIYLRAFRQAGQKVTLNGHAQSNEHVSTLLRNLGNVSPWLEQPELVEIRAATTGQAKDLRRVFEFTVNVAIKRSPRTEAAPAVVPVSVASHRP